MGGTMWTWRRRLDGEREFLDPTPEKSLHPTQERSGIYGTPKNIKRKTHLRTVRGVANWEIFWFSLSDQRAVSLSDHLSFSNGRHFLCLIQVPFPYQTPATFWIITSASGEVHGYYEWVLTCSLSCIGTSLSWVCPLFFFLLLFFTRVCFCLYGPFNCILFRKFFRQLRFLTLVFWSYFCLIGPFNYISLYESLPQPWWL